MTYNDEDVLVVVCDLDVKHYRAVWQSKLTQLHVGGDLPHKDVGISLC